MRVLLTGASGFIGRHIHMALSDAGHEVVTTSRRSGADFNRMLKEEDWLRYLEGVEAAINSVGIITETPRQSFSVLHTQSPSALFRACVTAGVTRVIQISALGADETAFTPYQLTKKAADDALRNMPLKWFILRPSLVYGEDGRSAALFRRLALLPRIPVIEQGRQLIQPVHIDDLVEAALICLTTENTCRSIDVAGPAVMSFAEWLQRLRRHAGKPPAPLLSLPLSVMLSIARTGQLCMPLMHPDILRMLMQGNTADVQPLCEWIGRRPHELP